jgi:hypothetical protein
MLELKITAEMLDRNIAGLETAIYFVEKKMADTHSGVDRFMLESFIIETREVIETLEASKVADLSRVFSYATQPEA